MDADFWHKKWHSNEIGFHESEVNPLLVDNIGQLKLTPGSRIFLPLCGKTLDIDWLLSQGYQIVGAELSELAISHLFERLGLEPEVSDLGHLKHYKAENIDIFVGDIFHLNDEALGEVDALYDRASLVALPADLRKSYTAQLAKITNKAPQLLICYEYEQHRMAGPPFSISSEEVEQHYGKDYAIVCVQTLDVEGGLRGESASESAYTLRKK